jgi:SanA protein
MIRSASGLKKIFLVKVLLLSMLGFLSLLVLMTNLWVLLYSKNQVFQSLDRLDSADVALVLGTSRSVNGVDKNPYFEYRMNAAAALYLEGKVKHLLVSGDNSSHFYNEPLDMKTALKQRGVPDSCITMDFAGLRTFDSIVRSQKVFKQQNVIVVSQKFHNYRALFIANQLGIQANAFCAQSPTVITARMHIRECLARTKAVFDVYLLGTRPRFLGKAIKIRV